jgi:hypothetical protein
MRRVINVVVAVVAAVTFSTMVLAQAPAQTGKKPAEKAAKVEKKASTLAANGKVAKFDEATKTLTLTTKEGDKAFTLGADAKIMAGANTASSADLPGKDVKVTYSQVNGKNVASKVTVAGTHATGTTAKKAEKK